jgi:UDP-N-acetylmuramoyl-L-alanyl-D-glutamate--2,6-diaminopimelate ligase
MGGAVESRADVAIVTADNPRHESQQAITRDILSGFERPARANVIADRKQAIHRALAVAEPDDCVLIAGKGHEQCQIIGNTRYALDDCDVVRRWLYNLEPAPATRHGNAWMALGNS